MWTEALCFVAGAAPFAAVAVVLERQRAWWSNEATTSLDLARKALEQRDAAQKEAAELRGRLSTASLRNLTLLGEVDDLRAQLADLPARDAKGRFVAREVAA